ncbi:transposase [Chryseobacterium sp. LC2016-29]|uniref:transposase n=1 Tax=Chryseobacterium sp. LC2016-29 TaxID=2897331 RepID=UPI001E3932CC|nr:transposase [Chryseobacterium sp. LC2016-29]MCD0477898.1 transposase [Chryseobacterium sp. LC2016-29]
MKLDYKKIHIGSLIRKEVDVNNIESDRICNFMNCKENEIQDMYEAVSLPTTILLQWCKLLEYDFFRIYSQHLILFSAKNSSAASNQENKSSLPSFRKNLYTKEIIKFILELIRTGEKTNAQIIEEYKIPKTTLLKWIEKY